MEAPRHSHSADSALITKRSSPSQVRVVRLSDYRYRPRLCLAARSGRGRLCHCDVCHAGPPATLVLWATAWLDERDGCARVHGGRVTRRGESPCRRVPFVGRHASGTTCGRGDVRGSWRRSGRERRAPGLLCRRSVDRSLLFTCGCWFAPPHDDPPSLACCRATYAGSGSAVELPMLVVVVV
eukprot:scaffold4745_cov125-Isochrysis_galbana.AAC.14